MHALTYGLRRGLLHQISRSRPSVGDSVRSVLAHAPRAAVPPLLRRLSTAPASVQSAPASVVAERTQSPLFSARMLPAAMQPFVVKGDHAGVVQQFIAMSGGWNQDPEVQVKNSGWYSHNSIHTIISQIDSSQYTHALHTHTHTHTPPPPPPPPLIGSLVRGRLDPDIFYFIFCYACSVWSFACRCDPIFEKCGSLHRTCPIVGKHGGRWPRLWFCPANHSHELSAFYTQSSSVPVCRSLESGSSDSIYPTRYRLDTASTSPCQHICPARTERV
jgi:hypothetical protein